VFGLGAPTIIVGDLGFFDAQSLVGPVTVTGDIVTNDFLIRDNILDVYNTIAAISPCTGTWPVLNTDTTFTPGSYCAVGSGTIGQDVVVTLDAQGDPSTWVRNTCWIWYCHGTRENVRY
jgi:hypothetical protein